MRFILVKNMCSRIKNDLHFISVESVTYEIYDTRYLYTVHFVFKGERI